MIKQILVAIGIFIVMVVGGLIFSQTMDGGKSEMAEVKIGEAIFQVEIANDFSERAAGLSGRDQLKDSNGMLFVFDYPAFQSFWMKDMKFPLDIIWIADNRVIGFEKKVIPDDGAKIYQSPAPADAVLEINANKVDELGIKIGDVIKLNL